MPEEQLSLKEHENNNSFSGYSSINFREQGKFLLDKQLGFTVISKVASVLYSARTFTFKPEIECVPVPALE